MSAPGKLTSRTRCPRAHGSPPPPTRSPRPPGAKLALPHEVCGRRLHRHTRRRLSRTLRLNHHLRLRRHIRHIPQRPPHQLSAEPRPSIPSPARPCDSRRSSARGPPAAPPPPATPPQTPRPPAAPGGARSEVSRRGRAAARRSCSRSSHVSATTGRPSATASSRATSAAWCCACLGHTVDKKGRPHSVPATAQPMAQPAPRIRKARRRERRQQRRRRQARAHEGAEAVVLGQVQPPRRQDPQAQRCGSAVLSAQRRPQGHHGHGQPPRRGDLAVEQGVRHPRPLRGPLRGNPVDGEGHSERPQADHDAAAQPHPRCPLHPADAPPATPHTRPRPASTSSGRRGSSSHDPPARCRLSGGGFAHRLWRRGSSPRSAPARPSHTHGSRTPWATQDGLRSTTCRPTHSGSRSISSARVWTATRAASRPSARSTRASSRRYRSNAERATPPRRRRRARTCSR